MSRLNTENPTNSSVVQMILDIEKCGIDIPDDLRRQITDKKTEIDDVWNSHQYPTESLVFTKLSRESAIFENLPKSEERGGVAASQLLSLIIQNVPQNLQFAIPTKNVAEIMGWSKSTVGRATKILVKYGIIAVIQEARGRGNPTVYKLNPMVADVGKPKSKSEQEEFWELAGEMESRRYIQIAEKNTTTDEVKTEDKFTYSVIKLKPVDEPPEEETKMTKKNIKKVESIQPLSAQQMEEIDSTFSIRH